MRSTRACIFAVILLAPLVGLGASAGTASAFAASDEASVDSAWSDVDFAGVRLKALGEADYADTFADVVVDERSGRIRLDITEQGAASDRLVKEAGSVPVDLRLVDNSFSKLATTMARVMSDYRKWKSSGIQFQQVGPEPDSNRVFIGVDTRDGGIFETLAATYGADVVRAGYLAGGESAASRYADTSPYNGGDKIDSTISGGPHCTTGYGAHTGSSPSATSSRMVLAGHCFANGATVYHNGAAVGTAVRSATVYFDGGIDYESISMTSSQKIWETDATRATSDGSVLSVPVGVTVCRSGSEVSKKCGTTSGVGQCNNATDIGMMFCHQGTVTSSALFAAGGDSGGPYFAPAYDSGGTRWYGVVGDLSILPSPLYTCTTHSGTNTKCSNSGTYTESSYIWSQYNLWPNY